MLQSFRRLLPLLAVWCALSLPAFAAPGDLPKLTVLPSQTKSFENGLPYLEIQMNLEKTRNSPQFRKFLQGTAEIIYMQDYEPFGHTILRVGETAFVMGVVQMAYHTDYQVRVGHERSRKFGLVFPIKAADVRKALPKIIQLWDSSCEYNLPPYDARSPLLPLILEDGGVRVHSPTEPQFGNHNAIEATLKGRKCNRYLEAPNGFRFPVEETPEGPAVQSLSCSSSGTYTLREFFGIDVPFPSYSRELYQTLMAGNPGGTAPSAVILYQ